MGLTDGLGGEEVNQTTNVQTTNIVATTSVSGLDVFAQGSGTFGRITDANGALLPANIGSPTSYGAFVQAGFVTTSAGSAGTVVFGKQFSNNAYVVTFSPGSLANGVNTSAYISGTRNVSGCGIVGGASATYNYIAVGL